MSNLKKLEPSEWQIKPCGDDDAFVLISVSENNGYRHWSGVKASDELALIDTHKEGWPVVWRSGSSE